MGNRADFSRCFLFWPALLRLNVYIYNGNLRTTTSFRKETTSEPYARKNNAHGDLANMLYSAYILKECKDLL